MQSISKKEEIKPKQQAKLKESMKEGKTNKNQILNI